MARVAILGTGLIGASIGLRLRQSMKNVEVVGYDRLADVARIAQKRGAIDRAARTAAEAVQGADLVILAVPVLAIRPMLEEIAPAIGPDTVVTDTGSSKGAIMRWAEELLPGHRGFVGGHPMAGKTQFGPEAADPRLFEGARWVVVPPVTASPAAVEAISKLVATLGATEVLMDPDEHDAYVAAVSHMPMMAAMALFSVERASEAWPELASLAAGGFRDMTRLSATDPAMAYDIVVTNRDHIVHWLDRYLAALAELRRRIADEANEDDLFKLIAATEWEYAAFLEGHASRQPLVNTMSSMDGIRLGDFIAGGWIASRMQGVDAEAERRAQEQQEADRLHRHV